MSACFRSLRTRLGNSFRASSLSVMRSVFGFLAMFLLLLDKGGRHGIARAALSRGHAERMLHESVLRRMAGLLRDLTHQLGDFALRRDSRHVSLCDDAGANTAIGHHGNPPDLVSLHRRYDVFE